MSRPLKVIVVEDNEVLCNLFADTLEKDPDIKTAQAHDLPEALRLCQLEPQVVLLVDLTIPGATGVDMVSHGRKAAPGATIVVITGDERKVDDAKKAGATTVIIKGSPESHKFLVKTIRDAVTTHEIELLTQPLKEALKNQDVQLTEARSAVSQLVKNQQDANKEPRV